MITAARIVFFLLLCLASAAGMLLLFPFLKEGSSQSELPLFLGAAGALAVTVASPSPSEVTKPCASTANTPAGSTEYETWRVASRS